MFYDTHAHLDYPEFAHELPEIVARANAAGVTKMLSVGTDLESTRRALALAERFPEIHVVAGWHPSNVTAAPDDVTPLFDELARHPKVAALGETGLDYHRLPSTQGGTEADDSAYKARQKRLFEQQLHLACRHGLNVVVHQRDALEDTLDVIAPFAGQLRAVFHCFVENSAVRQRLESLGFLVSFTGIVTFKNAKIVQETVAQAPSNGFMLETDCPYLAPVPYRGQRCEPAYVADIARKIAELRHTTPEIIGEQTSSVARSFFRGLA